MREKVVKAKYYEIKLEKPKRVCVLFEPFVLFDCVNCYFLFFPATFADAFFLNIPEPFYAVAIGVCAKGFEDDDGPVATFAF